MILNWPLITKTVPILCNLSLFRSPKSNCKLLTFVVWKYLMLVTKKSNLNLGMTKESTFNSHRAGSRWWNLKFVNFYIGHSISDLVHQLLYSQQIEFSMTNRLIGSRAFVWKIGGLNAVLKLCTLNTLTFQTLIDLLIDFTKDFEILSMKGHIVSSYTMSSEKEVHLSNSSQWDKTGIIFNNIQYAYNETTKIKDRNCRHPSHQTSTTLWVK